MRFSSWIVNGVRYLVRRRRAETELDEELEFHIDCRTDDLVRSGIPSDEARRRARLEFGGVENYREQVRDARGFRTLENLARDAAYACRTLRRSPGFTAAAAAALALGIGVNVALVSLVYGIALRPLPVSDPASVRNVFMTTRGGGSRSSYGTRYFVSFAEFTYMRDHARTADLAGIAETELSSKLALGGFFRAQLVSHNLLPLIGARPALGRFFLPEEASKPGESAVAVLSRAAWKNHFGGAADVVGRTVVMNRTPFVIVGVADERTSGPLIIKPHLWIPYTMQALTRPGEVLITDPNAGWIEILARRRPGYRNAEVQAEMSVLGQQALAAHGSKMTAAVTVSPAAFLNYPSLISEGAPVAGLLLAAVSLVLIVACANVANMLLARGLTRKREIAIRLSIGAGRGRLLQQFLTESALLGLLGGGLGILFSQAAARGVLALLPAGEIGSHQLDVSPDWMILVYALLLSLISSVGAGFLPARRLLRADLSPELKTGGPGTASRRGRFLLQNGLIAVQAAVSVILLISSGVLLRGFERALRADVGLTSHNLLIATFDLRQQQYTPESAERLLRAIGERAAGWAGVNATSATTLDPFLSRCQSIAKTVKSAEATGDSFSVGCEQVGPEFFKAMHIPILAGRDFEAADLRGGPNVVVIDECLARRHFGAEAAIGKRLRLGDTAADDHEIIGIVATTRDFEMSPRALPKLYTPLTGLRNMEAKLLVNYRGSAEPIAKAVRNAMAQLDANVNVQIKPVEENVANALAPVRMAAAAISGLGTTALVLACTGIYGVVAFTVGRRRREMGIRIALGARRAQVLRLIILQGLTPVAAGVAVGLILAVIAGRVAGAVVYGISPMDPPTLAAAAIGLIAVATLAALVPASTAARVDSSSALRCD